VTSPSPDATTSTLARSAQPRRAGRLTGLVAYAVLAALVNGCGEGADDAAPGARRTASNGDVFNDADVEFATAMIPHHAQALEMVTLTVERDLDPEVQALAEGIQAAQVPEVEQLSDWLTAWDEAVPATSLDHANAHGDEHDQQGLEGTEDMPGMMSADDMRALENSSAADFQDLWLEMMVEHHRGAVEMARTQQADGEFADAVALAESIESSQTAEIEQMESLLGS
jgi:uncharacterized protein (DUF305 family)